MRVCMIIVIEISNIDFSCIILRLHIRLRFVFNLYCRMSDEDEETNSLENDPIAVAFGNLQVDDKNANGGAHGKCCSI